MRTISRKASIASEDVRDGRVSDVAAAQLLVGVGSITSAQPSVGAAATCPTNGTIFRPADATRQGAAAKPQPLRAPNMARIMKSLHNLKDSMSP